MTRERLIAERLAALRRAGIPELAPLWIEGLPAEEALDELGALEGSIFRLQEARFLLQLGREEEAAAVLGRLPDLPAGLDTIRKGLLEELRQKDDGLRPTSRPGGRSHGETAASSESGLASVTLAELYATQGEAGAALAVYEQLLAAAPGNESLRRKVRQLRGEKVSEAEAALGEWLDRVRGWRRVLGV